MSEITQLY